MRIVFNLQSVGLGNNGGSRTLIKCAETLKTLGCDVILASPANRYTWHPIKVKVTPTIPKCDVIIATGYGSVPSTVQHSAAKKFYYIRGYEVWQAKEKNLVKSFRKLNCIVNSTWLKDKLDEHGIESDLIYPGLDYEDFWIDESVERQHIIGGLFSKRHKTKRHLDIIAAAEKLGHPLVMLNRDIRNPDPDKLREFYNGIKVWVAPTELEGLHNCPMEASLCGCGLVATDHARNGMYDYLEETALIYPARDVEVCVENIERLMTDDILRDNLNQNMISLLKTKIGDRETNMKKMLDLFRS